MILRGGSPRQPAWIGSAARTNRGARAIEQQWKCKGTWRPPRLDGPDALLGCRAPHADEGKWRLAVGFRGFLDDLFATTINNGRGRPMRIARPFGKGLHPVGCDLALQRSILIIDCDYPAPAVNLE